MSDREREKNIYQYILNLLPLDKPGNLSEISDKLYSQKKSDPAKKILNLIEGRTNQLPAKLTTEQLVELIKNLKESLEQGYQDSEKKDFLIPKLLRKEDTITLLTYLVNLSADERQSLGISKSEVNLILQQSIFNLYRYHTNIDKAKVLELYKSIISVIETNNKKLLVNDSEENADKIEMFIEQYLSHLGLDTWTQKDEKAQKLKQAIERHIKRLKSQAGINELSSIDERYIEDFEKSYLTDSFLERLVYSTIENCMLREQIPIYVQYFEITRLKSLPIYYPTDEYEKGLLNPEIIEPEKTHDNTGLASQHAYKATISFNLKIPDKNLLDEIKSTIPDEIIPTLVKKDKGGLVFTVSSTGVGGQIAQLIKIINRVLFWDIECIRDQYFPIAHDLVIYQEVVANNIASPVWSHNLVKLCSSESLQADLAKAEDKNNQDSKYSLFDEIGTGDYCGFNFTESVIKSALQARLSALQKADIEVKKYIESLRNAVTSREILRTAESYLNYYPFSLSAMESYLDKHLLSKAKKDTNGYLLYLHYDAHLLITTAYLREGLYRKALKQLQRIQELESFNPNASTSIHQNNFRIFSGTILAKYERCKAYYFYICDHEEQDPEYRWSNLDRYDKAELVIQSWESLNKAEKHLNIRLKKYAVINEISQGLFHPHFIILANINFLRAKIFLYFSRYANVISEIPSDIDNSINRKLCCYKTIYYLERARICAAKNGNTLDYACYTAYQSYAYIKNAYVIGKKTSLKIDKVHKTVDFSRKNCLKWSKDLLDDALINYGDFGRICYLGIKDNSGVDVDQSCGDYRIKSLPLIQENFIKADTEDSSEEILHLDMNLLCMKKLDDSSEKLNEHVYLFGAKAAIILFARAMYQLCGNDYRDTKSTEKWQSRLKKAYRLFNYAWAVAEDGCKVTTKPETEQEGYTIERPLLKDEKEKDEYENSEPEVKSVLDLYPHRQSEIADLGKVFAAACQIILLHTENSEEQKEIRKEKIKFLLERLEDKQRSRTNSDLTEGQESLNGHLREYFTDAKRNIEHFKEEAKKRDGDFNNVGISAIRDKIVKALFN
ncbi:MAG: hypothetical protein AAGE84_00115 [Cyanobacteria bacterium P01_G01_bin.39]